MKNCLILGAGRSGTSMLAGLLSQAGYYMGDEDSYGEDKFNPKGHFEWRKINVLNEEIMILAQEFCSPGSSLPMMQNWLSHASINIKIEYPKHIEATISEIIGETPFCIKDPRFSFTVPVWKPYLKEVVYLCVFRHPSVTIQSMINFSQEVYRKKISFSDAIEVWLSNYKSIIRNSKLDESWLFVHFDQIIDNSCFNKIREMTGAKLHTTFPDPDIKSSHKSFTIPECNSLYRELCFLAGMEYS